MLNCPSVASVIARKYLPIDPGHGGNPLTRVWIPQAIADPVLFLATVNVAAIHLDITRRQFTPATIARKGKVMRLINQKLLDPAQALSNETIGSVVMLAGYEVFMPHFSLLKAFDGG